MKCNALGFFASGDKGLIDKHDFKAQAEIPAIVCRSDYDPSDIGNYGCSFFDDLEMLRIILHMPRKNKQIAGGVLKKESEVI